MTMNEGYGRKTVRCRCGPLKAEATYEASPFLLTLTMPFGTVKTAIGLQDPHRLASRILKDRCRKEAAAIASTTAQAESLTPILARKTGAPHKGRPMDR